MLTHVALIDAVGAARPDVLGLLGTARYYALAAPFSFCRVEWCATRPGSVGFHVGLSAGACPRLRAIGVLLRYCRDHALSPRRRRCHSPWGRRYPERYSTSRRFPIARRDDCRRRAGSGD